MSSMSFRPHTSMVKYVPDNPHLVVLNSPGKLFNIQGLNCGYGVYGDPKQQKAVY